MQRSWSWTQQAERHKRNGQAKIKNWIISGTVKVLEDDKELGTKGNWTLDFLFTFCLPTRYSTTALLATSSAKKKTKKTKKEDQKKERQGRKKERRKERELKFKDSRHLQRWSHRFAWKPVSVWQWQERRWWSSRCPECLVGPGKRLGNFFNLLPPKLWNDRHQERSRWWPEWDRSHREW